MRLDFWNNKKRKLEAQLKQIRREREQTKRVKRTERNLSKSVAVNLQTVGLLNESIKSENSLQEKISNFNKQVADFQKKVDENQRLQQKLQNEKSRLSSWEEELKNHAEEIRKEELSVHIRSESVKKEELRIGKKDSDLDSERQNIKDERVSMKERISKAEKAEKEYLKEKETYEEKKKSYEKKIKDLDSREEKCRVQEEDISKRLSELNISREELNREKEHWETERAEIENNLNEKIKEYDRKMADMNALKDTLDNSAFDDSEDGKKAKIVVKETIRVATKALEESLQKFKELDEKYSSGTFKGFSIPMDEISLVLEELKNQYAAIKEHAESSGLDFSIWLEKIENAILEADKNFKSFLFAECYRNALEGLSYCNGYADIINILNEYAGSADSSYESSTGEPESEWEDYYEFLFGDDYDCNFDYSQVSEKDLKKQYRKMAKKYHPDTAPEDKIDEYTDKTTHLNEIWEVLSDSEKKAEYDKKYAENRKSRKAA